MVAKSTTIQQGDVHDSGGAYPNLQPVPIFTSSSSAAAGSLTSPVTSKDRQWPVAVGPAEQQHNRLQSRPQSASAHKRKGWHAVQQRPAEQPSQTGRAVSNPTAVYVRPDQSVTANLSLDNSPTFPSLGNFANALPNLQTNQGLNTIQPGKSSSWSSPVAKHQAHQPSRSQSSASTAAGYAAAVSPAKAQQSDSGISKHMAMSDSELADITNLLGAHPWAEPGLARAVLAAVNHNVPAADLLLREMEQHQAPSGSDSDEESANHIITPHSLASQPLNETQTHSQFGHGHACSPQTQKASAPPTSRSSYVSSARGTKQNAQDHGADEDLYYKHRREALKLFKSWHKKLHQAANAFAAAHYSEGKTLAMEAHQDRLKGVAAHAEAAQKIEHANNAGRGLSHTELDLHGLHATEAVEALDRRLHILGQQQHYSQAAKLRVIVGRGNNSSGGEASLPRVIESHLLQRNMNYIIGQGVITVYLRGLRH